jgi:cytochrome c oxidase subunit III
MAATVVSAEEQKKAWEGGTSPLKASYGKLMMWFFLVSDAFTFSCLLIAYAAIRLSHEWWPDPAGVFSSFPFVHDVKVPLGFVTVMTFILILSSVFVVLAVIEGHRMNKKGVLFWMFWGIIGGFAFLGCQAWEWNHLIHQGMTLYWNPFDANGVIDAAYSGTKSPGPVAFGNLFFVITGFHGFHVFSGVIFNIIIWIQAAGNVYQKRGHYEMVEKVGLYWHFVDLVWVFVFLAFYLL